MPSITFKSILSNKKTLAKRWLSSTSTASWQESFRINPTKISPDDAPQLSRSRILSRSWAALIQRKAASTWNIWEKWHTSCKTRWSRFQQSPSASRSIKAFKVWLWSSSRTRFVLTFPNQSQLFAALIHQPPLSPAASSSVPCLSSLLSLVCSNYAAPSSNIGNKNKVLESPRIPFQLNFIPFKFVWKSRWSFGALWRRLEILKFSF